MSNVDQKELNKFADLAAHWWDEAGELKTLHQVNPLRLGFIKQKVNLTGLKALDIGCGGGILTESLAAEKANATGIDLNPSLIDVAKLHLYESKLKVTYQTISAEDFAKTHSAQFNVVTCMELLEHVPDPASIIQACADLTAPGGDVFFSTLNRHPKAYVLAILGAEYLLRLLPRGTHDYAKFIRPAELSAWCEKAGLTLQAIRGISYNPITKQFRLSDDIDVNYIVHATKAG